jgi:hypothetical protein
MFRLCSDPPTTIDMMLINIDTPMFSPMQSAGPVTSLPSL